MEKYSQVNFLVGINGCGKSQLLNSIGQTYLRKNSNVLAISNTVFDKFSSRGYKKLSAKAGKNFLKKTIIDSLLNENERIYNILEYLGYEKELGVLISFYSDFDGDLLTYLTRSIDKYNKFNVVNDKDYIDYDFDELMIFCDQLKEYLYSYSHNEYLFDFIYREHVGRNIQILSMFRRLYELFSNKKIIKIDFLLSKDLERFKLNGASSGESHFLAQMLFLDNNLNKKEKNIILIDEPEISLHPKWQREYIFKLYDYFYMYNVEIFIATHSPLMISKLQVNKEKLYDDYIGTIQYRIFQVIDQKLTVIEEDKDYSIESLYWEVFGILTPDNSFLSRYCIDLLDKYDLKKIDYNEIENKFRELKEASDLEIQRQTLDKIFHEFVRR